MIGVAAPANHRLPLRFPSRRWSRKMLAVTDFCALVFFQNQATYIRFLL
jgi:hypothetical protein